MKEVSRPRAAPWKPETSGVRSEGKKSSHSDGDLPMYGALAGAQVVCFPLRRHLKSASFCFISTTRLFIERCRSYFSTCSGKSLITFAVSFGIVAVYGGSLVALSLPDVPNAIGAQTTAWRLQLSGLGSGEFLSWRRGVFGRGVGFGTTEATNFAENVTKCWHTAREGCILVRLSYCPESILRRD